MAPLLAQRDDGSWQDQHRVALITCLSVFAVILVLVPVIYIIIRALQAREREGKYRRYSQRKAKEQSEHKRNLSGSSDASSMAVPSDEKHELDGTAVGQSGHKPTVADLESGAFKPAKFKAPCAEGIAHAQQQLTQDTSDDADSEHGPRGWMMVGAKRYG